MRPGEVGNASVAARQVRQNLPARGIGQRGKSSVQRSRRIFNHLVNYLAESLERANYFLTICRSREPTLCVRQIRTYNYNSIRIRASAMSACFISM